jgi:hypothetical protein
MRKRHPDPTAAALMTGILEGRNQQAIAHELGIHPFSLGRRIAKSPELQAIRERARYGKRLLRAARGDFPRDLLSVPIRETCPECEAPIEYATGRGFLRFVRCSRGACPWASWQPPSPFDCAECGSALYWTHTRQHLRCRACNVLVEPVLLAKDNQA